MSIEDLLAALGRHPLWLAGYFLGLPVLAWGLGLLPSRGRSWSRCVSTVIYLVAVPGTVSAVLIGYALFFVRGNLLQVDVLVYFLPVLSMFVTFGLVRRVVAFDRLPGFGRLSGLMMLIGLTFVVLLLLQRTRILVGFFGSLEAMAVLAVVLFLAFQYAARRLFGPSARSR